MTDAKQELNKVFAFMDQRDFEQLDNMLTDVVNVDYSSLTSVNIQELTRLQVIEELKELLPGFTHTSRRIHDYHMTRLGDSTLIMCCSEVEYKLKLSDERTLFIKGLYKVKMNMEKGLVSEVTFNLDEIRGDKNLLVEAWQIANNIVKNGDDIDD